MSQSTPSADELSSFAPYWMEICARWGFADAQLQDQVRMEAWWLYRKAIAHERAKSEALVKALELISRQMDRTRQLDVANIAFEALASYESQAKT